MKFAVALIALTFSAQSFVPVFAQSTDFETVASMPLVQGTSVNVLGGEGAASSRHLDLSDSQKEKFYEIRNRMLSEAGPKKAALADQKRLIKDLLTKPTIDRKAVQAAQDKINSLRTDLANVAIASRLDMSEELTPEQRKIMRYRHHGKHGHHRHHGGKSMGGHHRASQDQDDKVSSEPSLEEDDFVATNF